MSTLVEQKIEKMLRAGVTLTDIETKLKLPYVAIKQIADEIGWDVSWRNKKDKYEMHTEKYDTIYDLIVNDKMTLQEVGDIFEISRERVRQILEDMDVRIRDIKHEEDELIKGELFELLLTGEYTPKEASEQLNLSYGIVDRVMKSLTPSQINRYRAAYITNEFYKTKDGYKFKMEIALDMWITNEPTSDIADAMAIKRAYLNQLIIKCRKRYGWFPAKYAARFDPASEKDTISKLIREDRAKRDPDLAKKIKAEKKQAKAEAAKAKAVRARENAAKDKVKIAKAKERAKKKEAKEKAALAKKNKKAFTA